MSLSVTVLGESHCFSDFPGPAGVPAENSSRVRSPAAPGGTTRQPVPEARWRICKTPENDGDFMVQTKLAVARSQTKSRQKANVYCAMMQR